MPTNRKEHLRYRYGICLNDSCSKCKSKEVQQIAARKDFVCEECQKPLRECPPPKSFRDKYGKAIIGVAVVLLGIGIALVWKFQPKNNVPADDGPDTVIEKVDTGNPIDTVHPIDTVKPEPIDTATQEPIDTAKGPDVQKPPVPQPQKPAGIKVPFGVYSGPANGMDGKITVTRNYALDLRNTSHEIIELRPGDVITRTQFRNGELVNGYLQRGSESRTFHR